MGSGSALLYHLHNSDLYAVVILYLSIVKKVVKILAPGHMGLINSLLHIFLLFKM